MAQFVTIHRAPTLTQEEIIANAKMVLEQKHARFVESFVSLADGFIVTVYEADSAADVQREFERVGFPVDEMHEAQVSFTRERLEEMVASHGRPR
ncbi:MAG: nickel-binding protein [Candidatus Binatia bacterium]